MDTTATTEEDQLSTPVRADDHAQHLRTRMQEHKMQSGDRLPTFSAIRERYGAATNTVDRAYSMLEGGSTAPPATGTQ